MRSEKEMLDLIIRTAREDERIIAAYLEGSRVDPNAQKDIFRDYDVEYIVRDTAPFIADKSWIDRFGERLFMQYPDDCPFEKSDTKNCYGWLIRFSDGNRLDLHVCTPEHALKNIDICRVLVDKENIIPQDIGKDTTVFNVKKPTQAEFSAVCNEFWWCLDNVAKGLWRGELSYTLEMMDFNIRPQLRQMLDWLTGAENGFTISTGKSSKYMARFLPEEICSRYLSTYCAARANEIWDAVGVMTELFDETARKTTAMLDYCYNEREAAACIGYLDHVRNLPQDAFEIY